MEQHNSGANMLEVWDVRQGWVPLLEAFLTEGTEYRIRCQGKQPDVRIHGIPLPFYRNNDMSYADFITSFQSGVVKISINDQQYETYIYPDDRKLTMEQFNRMLEEILEEANACYHLSGLETKVSTSGRNRDISWTQWSYIDQTFFQLRQIFLKIERQPFRRLERVSVMMKREKVRHSEQMTLRWLDSKGYGEKIPGHVQNEKKLETMDLYENQVLKQQLQELYRLLGKYETVEHKGVVKKSAKYKGTVKRWLNSSFLKEVTENKGHYTITQKFRKHPVYHLWYQWFDQLYKHKQDSLGFDYPISLKDTFQLYEMWCFMKIVKIFREAGLVLHTNGLYKTSKDGIFLNLAENKESNIQLLSGLSLFYQRSYQYDTKKFFTFTQKMIPDIVIESEAGIIVFDPKYRVPTNLGTALGEMHKYRDGIIHRQTGQRAVKEVYILTPTKAEQADGIRYFQEKYHERFGMGAIQAVPGEADDEMKRKIVTIFRR
ncbi:DUF2357 domain-containing protein [Neobacillus kokaensis]|uniref:DUF2357 domain-containing protein n=1 Tax=Neobacillus kokaensis TaxID=2759023 RepID=A0ABQ3N6S5_9BACI|nr:DUF2357 domain-containing protein [Neobacillus kokaensis]GHH99741.1 hypothetical protein AM1BK_32840 [Neobacillus kokaensis]